MEDIELPRDAVGREIPLDTTALFDGDGNVHRIVRWAFVTDFDSDGVWSSSWQAVTDTDAELGPELMYLAPPDSWERLFEDLDRAVGANNVCMYFSEGGTCLNCAIRNTSGGCSPKVLKHILGRIRKLRGEGE